MAFVGNATEDPSISGIYAYAVDESGGLELQQFVAQPHPHGMTRSPSGDRLFAASFVAVSDGSLGGSIYSYAVHPEHGPLTATNHQILPFTYPSCVQTDRTERFLLVACTSGGGVLVLPIGPSGSLGAPSSVHALGGAPWVPLGATEHPPVRPPDSSIPHGIGSDPTNRLVVVPDLNLDRLVLYRFDAGAGRLDPVGADVGVPKDSGPRHLVFHPTTDHLYVINETASSISIFSYDADAGSVQFLHTVPAVPDHFDGSNMSAEIVLAEDGKYLYCTNRGHDSIAMFAVSDSLPYLQPLGWEPTNGRGPRGLALAPGGRLLFVANRGSDCVASFAVSRTSGLLEATGSFGEVAAPSSVVLV